MKITEDSSIEDLMSGFCKNPKLIAKILCNNSNPNLPKIKTVGELLPWTESTLFAFNGLGKVKFYAIKDALSKNGFVLLGTKNYYDRLKTACDTTPINEKLTEESSVANLLNFVPNLRIGWLVNAEIKTIGELCTYSERDLLKFRDVGRLTVDSVKKILAQNGFALADQDCFNRAKVIKELTAMLNDLLKEERIHNRYCLGDFTVQAASKALKLAKQSINRLTKANTNANVDS